MRLGGWSCYVRPVILLLLLCGHSRLLADTQSVQLRRGWNLVAVHIEPTISGADAGADAQHLQSQGGQFHRLNTAIVEELRHPPGRPARDRPRPVSSVRYTIQLRPRA